MQLMAFAYLEGVVGAPLDKGMMHCFVIDYRKLGRIDRMLCIKIDARKLHGTSHNPTDITYTLVVHSLRLVITHSALKAILYFKFMKHVILWYRIKHLIKLQFQIAVICQQIRMYRTMLLLLCLY